MKSFRLYMAICCMASILSCNDNFILKEADSTKAVNAFPITAVKLLDGPFLHATQLNEKSLLQYEPDRLLARFRQQAGLAPKAEKYGGWESESLAGHSLGHYLSGCALMYQSSANEAFKERAQYIVDELATIQAANGGEYLGAFDNGKSIFEEEVAKGEIETQSFNLNGIWAPFYTHHKLMAGLRDAYRLLGIAEALEIEQNFADWIGSIVLGLTDAQAQKMMECEFGGIQEVLADLYIDTGEEKYLEIAKVFNHQAILAPLAEGKDILPNIHGNTQIPKMIAATRMFELTEESIYKEAPEFFWKTVVNDHSYVTGGHGNHEYFGQPRQLTNRLSNETTETCNVYNMLKLSRNLFEWQPDAQIADFYERALFNHILASQHPQTGRVIYNLSLEMGGSKHYQNPMSFTCCVGSGMETHSKYGANIYYHNEEALYVGQYISSALYWEEKGLRLTQKTQFPEAGKSTFTFKLPTAQTFSFMLRYPYWAEKGIQVRINGEEQKIEASPGSFIAINRKWEDGDQVEIEIPFSLRLEAMPDDENRIALFNGPLVLAGDLGPLDDPKANTKEFVPVLMSEEREPQLWTIPIEGAINSFKTQGIGNPRDITLKPFYQTHDRRYSVYFDLYNQEKWEAREQAIQETKEAKAALEAITYDAFQPLDPLDEAEHQFQGDSLNRTRDFRGRKARGAERGGWLSFEMKIKKGTPMDLVVEYWGGFTGSKTFDILINGEKVATENISGKKDGHFLDVHYPIPESISKQKDKVLVKFDPHVGHRAGPFFYVRTVER